MYELSFPEKYEKPIEEQLHKFNLTLRSLGKIAYAIKKLSDFYIQFPERETPWDEIWAQVAYLAYYFPLNYLRVQHALIEAQRFDFLNDTNTWLDYGCGPGTASLALLDNGVSCDEIQLVERAKEPEFLFQALNSHSIKTSWSKSFSQDQKIDLGIFSYSLTEVDESMELLQSFSQLMILEPSTQQDGRQLIQLRQKLIDNGFFIWSPCTHQKQCPLLLHSKKDWCHHRLHWKMPSWFHEIEKQLPMKNGTLTYSYLLAAKTPSPAAGGTFRLTGDLQKEKGKSKIMACRGEEREFLSWLKKEKIDLDIRRGDLLQVSESEKKGAELRPGYNFKKVEC